MNISNFIETFKTNTNSDWMIWNNQTLQYTDLVSKIEVCRELLGQKNIKAGDVISVCADFTPGAIALIIALIENNNIIVPLASPLKDAEQVKFEIAEIEWRIDIDLETDEMVFTRLVLNADHAYYTFLRQNDKAGLVLFTSGTSGKPKAAVHDFEKLLKKFERPRKSMRTINFLLFDHWGGLNTLFHTLSNAGMVLALRNRKPETVCEYIQEHAIELLPVSPSFLNLLILSEVYKKYDLASLKLITYGTEPMPETTLKKAREIFHWVQFQQTYGLIELGVLRSKSREDGSLWVKLGGEGYELRVVDNLLEIKAESAMLGYLNADSPFTEDGYFKTGDMVEREGEYYKILGRKSELINVGGDKVYPQEVENVLLEYPGILDATVYPEKHVLMGNIVCAMVSVKEEVDFKELIKELRRFCRSRLQPFKVPVKITVDFNPLYNDRFKKRRVI